MAEDVGQSTHFGAGSDIHFGRFAPISTVRFHIGYFKSRQFAHSVAFQSQTGQLGGLPSCGIVADAIRPPGVKTTFRGGG
ncbi:hypothetical protein DUT91_20435 [Phyllobacterium salinisoli]|uniref:Uncharacterized protein n=1 Tax=Phyllobacterium salinisoli TaxID=1899321 RepID=A0A368K0V5_9HYPH|nr:hypothetical protein DUT91_20435 [Phyllobacterium salinisoli]